MNEDTLTSGSCADRPQGRCQQDGRDQLLHSGASLPRRSGGDTRTGFVPMWSHSCRGVPYTLSIRIPRQSGPSPFGHRLQWSSNHGGDEGWGGGGPSRPDRLLMEETLPGDVRSEDVIVAVEGNQTETFIMLHRSYDNNVTLMCLTWTSVGVTPDSCRFKFEKTISEFHRAIWACPGCSVKLSDVYTKKKIQTHGSMFKMKLFFMSCVTVLSVVGNVFKSFTSVKVA